MARQGFRWVTLGLMGLALVGGRAEAQGIGVPYVPPHPPTPGRYRLGVDTRVVNLARYDRGGGGPAAAFVPPGGRPGGHRLALEVIGVDWNGPAARAGLEVGDIIVAVNGSPTPDVYALRRALAFSPGGYARLTVRDGRPPHRYVTAYASLGRSGGGWGSGPAVHPRVR